MTVKIFSQRIYHCTVQHTYLFSVKCLRISSNVSICLMLHKVIRFTSHRKIRISYKFFPFFLICKARNNIYFTVKKHIINLSEAAINILIFPACVLRKFKIILIRISRFYDTIFCPFLKDFIFIVSYSYRFGLFLCSPSYWYSKCHYYCQYYNKSGYCFIFLHCCILSGVSWSVLHPISVLPEYDTDALLQQALINVRSFRPVMIIERPRQRHWQSLQ